jgi:hypothetical protein
MAINLLIPYQCLVIFGKLESTIDHFHFLFDCPFPKVSPHLPINPKCFFDQLRKKDAIHVNPSPVPRFNFPNDSVMLLQDVSCPPGKGRFFQDLVSQSVHCYLDRVSFLESLVRDPR